MREGGESMMPRHASEFIGLRVSKPVKKSWTAKAQAEERSLSKWIYLQVEKATDNLPTQDAPSKA
jgi:predicted HicB family RNase H-like nuclease